MIYSNAAEEQDQRLEEVLRRIDEANLQLHPAKCVIAHPDMRYLGYVLSERGVSASPEKVTAVKLYPVPKNVNDDRHSSV